MAFSPHPDKTLPELQMNPADIEMRKQTDIDETGKTYEVQVPFPIWAKAKAGGGTSFFCTYFMADSCQRGLSQANRRVLASAGESWRNVMPCSSIQCSASI